jgi:hypothetical protein
LRPLNGRSDEIQGFGFLWAVSQQQPLSLGLLCEFWPVGVRRPDPQLLHAAMSLLEPVPLKLGQTVLGSLWPWHVRPYKVARDQTISTIGRRAPQ